MNDQKHDKDVMFPVHQLKTSGSLLLQLPLVGMGNLWTSSFSGVVICLILVCQSGCQIFRGFGTKTNPTPVVFKAMPSQADLINRINAQSARVKQLQSNVSLELPGVPRLSGTVTIERPKRLRLKAGIGGITELGVDVGSNEDLFWLWNKASTPGQPPPTIYFARHGDFQQLQQDAALPIDPRWIIDAFGLVEFSDNDYHQGPKPDQAGNLELVTIHRTDSEHITRVSKIDSKSGLIKQQAMYDSNNRRIAYSNALNFTFLSESGVSLPQTIELYVTAPNGQDMKMVISANNYRVNSFFGNPDQTWSIPRPDGVPVVDLAEAAKGPINANYSQ